MQSVIDEIAAALRARNIVPYLGTGATPADAGVPGDALALAAGITAKSAVPFKIRNRLPSAAQYIENFKHRKTLNTLMTEQFAPRCAPQAVHKLFAESGAPLLVHVWYDDALYNAFEGRTDWGCVQGLSQAEHFGEWVAFYDHAGALAAPEAAGQWSTLLYQPIGCVRPARNYIVSDSDYVEVLTEIDIQTPIPARVQELRSTRSFLFVGCRFADQLERSYARQVMKRSGERHWAVIEGTLTRNEARFIEQQGITRVDMSLAAFTEALQSALTAGAGVPA